MKLMSLIRNCIILTILIILAFIITLNIIFVISNSLIIYFFVVFTCFLLLFILIKKINISEKQFLISFACFAVIIKTAFAIIIAAAPVSDFYYMYQAAQQVSIGDFSFQESPYFFYWAYQTGFVIYEALIMKIFGETTLALRIINGFIMTGINIIVYLIAKRITNNYKCGMLAALLYFFYPAPYLLASVLTNQHLATFFIILGLYHAIRNTETDNVFLKAMISGLMIAIGNIMRPIGIITVISLMFFYFYQLIQTIYLKKVKGTWQPSKSLLIKVCITFGTYALIGVIAANIIKFSGINEQGLKNNDPYWKFVVGLNVETGGGYSDDLVSLVYQVESLEERYEIEKKQISDSVSSILANPLKFIYRKGFNMWAQYEDANWSFGEGASVNRDTEANKVWNNLSSKTVKLDKCYFLILMMLAMAGILYMAARKRIDRKACLILSIFIVYFIIHLVVEVQTRYRYFSMPFICIMASYFNLLLENTSGLVKKSAV